MADVARMVGVSHQTVSRVLNDSPLVRPETRSKVLEAIDQLGYRRNSAARALVTNRSGRIGVVVAHVDERGPAMVANALQDAALAAGYEIALVSLADVTATTLRSAVRRLLEQSVEALVVAVTHREALTLGQHLDLGVPVILVEGVIGGQPLTAGVAQREGGMLATSHLLGLGHRSVAHLAGPAAWIEASERREGWLAAHAEAGAQPGREWSGDWTAASGYAAGASIAADPDVTAVFVANDQMALGLLLALREAGRAVPHDVSVVGFDDLPEAAYFSPPLTTVHQDFAELAGRAVDLLVRALDGEVDPVVALVPARLVERASSGPSPQKE
ncbi:LacI family DNA-binding transcriptional regulator [Nocardioides pacificus]